MRSQGGGQAAECYVSCRPKTLLLFSGKKNRLRMMRLSSMQESIKQLSRLPTASGGLSRLAANRLRRADIKLEPLLSCVGLTVQQIDDPEQRIDARRQIAFLETAAKALNDAFLGFNLAQEFDCRDLGLLYYVMASSDTLGDALKRASRYSRITNEGIVLEYLEAPHEPMVRLIYAGIPRHADRQQIEFCILAMVRVCRLLSGRRLLPKHVSIIHARSKGISRFADFLGKNIEFRSICEKAFSISLCWLCPLIPRISDLGLRKHRARDH